MKRVFIVAVVILLLQVAGCGRTNDNQEIEMSPPIESQKVEIVSTEAPQEDKRTMYGRLSKSVVLINMYDDNNEIIGTASGFFVFDSATLITCDHVIEGSYYLEAVCEDGSSTLCKEVIAHDAERDLAILKCETPLSVSPLTLADSSIIAQGDPVFVIGSPLGLQNTISEGIVGGIRADADTDIVQITAPISSGSSGGAVFNENGEVIGIASASFTRGQNLNLAIASNEVSELLNERLLDSEYILLSDLYADFTAYGASSMNLVRGVVTENREYVFFVDTETTIVSQYTNGVVITDVVSARIVQYSKKDGEYKELDTGNYEARNLNVYRNKLYFSNRLSDGRYGVYSCDIGDHFGENLKLLLSVNSEGKANLDEFINQLLIAEDLLIVSVNSTEWETRSDEFHVIGFSTSLRMYDLNYMEIVQISEFKRFVDFSYFDNTLYIIDSESNDLVGINLREGTVNRYSIPSAADSLCPITDGFLLWDSSYNEEKTETFIYKFNAIKQTFSLQFADYCYGITDACVCRDNTVLVVEEDERDALGHTFYHFVTYSIQSNTKTKYTTQFTDGFIKGMYLLDYDKDIPKLGWKSGAILGLWNEDGNGSCLRG